MRWVECRSSLREANPQRNHGGGRVNVSEISTKATEDSFPCDTTDIRDMNESVHVESFVQAHNRFNDKVTYPHLYSVLRWNLVPQNLGTWVDYKCVEFLLSWTDTWLNRSWESLESISACFDPFSAIVHHRAESLANETGVSPSGRD